MIPGFFFSWVPGFPRASSCSWVPLLTGSRLEHGPDNRDDDPEHAEVFAYGTSDDGLKDAGAGVESALAAISAHRPLHPADGNANDNERDEVGDHEGAPAVFCSLAGESEEVAQAYRTARDGQDDSQP